MWSTVRFFKSACRFPGVRLLSSRFFMSSNFSLSDVWDDRLNSKILKNVKLEEFYCELENKYVKKENVSTVDIDIFTNSVRGNSHLLESEDLIHKFRLSSEANKILPSTQHAFIRVQHKYGDQEELLRILDDRLNYGIFPDEYCYLLLMDNYIKNEDYRKAAKVAALQMLQEDFSSPLLKYLSLYSCHKYLLNPEEWSKTEEEPVQEVEEEEEEEIKVRVKYLRNPYFDGHFDLKDSDSLIGKTLIMIGETIEEGLNYRLLGLVLFRKYEEAKILIDKIAEEKNPICADCLELAEKCLKNLPVKEGEEENQNQEEVTDLISQIENLKNVLKLETDLLSKIEGKIKKIVSETENEIIAQQKETYKKWDSDREELLLQEVNELNRLARLEEVERKKQELKSKEDELFFFDNEDELDIRIENKKVRYPSRKWVGKKKKAYLDNTEYIPPEVKKKREPANI